MSQALLKRYHRTRSYHDFTTLVRETMPHVYRVCYRVTGDRQLAEDSTQEVFLRVLSVDPATGGSTESDVGSLTNKAISISRTLRRSRARRGARERAVGQDPESTRGGTSLSPADLLDLEDALGTLPPQQRRCIELVYYGGLRQRDVAVEMNLAPNTVRARLAEAIAALRRRLAPVTAGFVLPVLLGKASAWAGAIRVSREFADKFHELQQQARALDPAAASGSAGASSATGSAAGRVVGETGARKVALWGASAALAVILGILAVWRLSSGSEVGVVEADAAPIELALAATALPPVELEAPSVDAEPVAASEAYIPEGGCYPLGFIVQLIVDSFQTTGSLPRRPPSYPTHDPDSKEPASIAIHVLDPDGRSLPWARVGIEQLTTVDYSEDRTIRHWHRHSPTGTEEWHSANADGVLLFDDFPRELHGLAFHAVAEADGYLRADVGIFTPLPGKPKSLYVTLEKEVTSSLVVTDATTGNPIAGAKMWISELRSGSSWGGASYEIGRREGDPAGETDSRGVLPLVGFSANPYSMIVCARGYRPAVYRSLQLPDELEVQLTRDSRPWTASLRIEVFDAQGLPVEGVPFRLELDWRGYVIYETTDARGCCLLEGIPEGNHLLRMTPTEIPIDQEIRDRVSRVDCLGHIQIEEGARKELVLRASSPTYTQAVVPVETPEKSVLTVQVRDHEGSLLKGVGVAFENTAHHTDSTGQARFETYRTSQQSLYIGVGGTAWLVATNVGGMEPGSTQEAFVRLGHATIRGRVECEGDTSPDSLTVSVHGPWVSDVKPEGGSFELSRAHAGEYVLTIDEGVLYARETVIVPPDDDPPEVVLRPTPRSSLALRLLASDGTFAKPCAVHAQHVATGEEYGLKRQGASSGPEYCADHLRLGETRLFVKQPGLDPIVATIEIEPRAATRLTGTIRGGKLFLTDDGDELDPDIPW